MPITIKHFLPLITLALVACADMQKLQLPSPANRPAIQAATVSEIELGAKGGYMKTVNVPLPRGTCDGAAFADGYRFAYMLNWNQSVDGKINVYALAAKQNPGDKRAKAINDLYKDKRFKLGGVGGKEQTLGLSIDSKGGVANYCQSSSYQAGKNAGLQDVGRDLRALQVQEPA